MGVIKSGHNSAGYPDNFGASDAVTADALNDHVNDSTFDTTAVDDSTIEVYDSGAKIRVKDDGVTFAKMQNISTDKVLGRTTAGSGAIEELDFLDENDMNSDSDTAVATQQSIKAYVDATTDQLIGVGQTWQSVTRAVDSTEYTNDTGKPIMVNGSFSGNTDGHQVFISIKPSGGSYVEFTFARSTNSGGGVVSNGSTIVPVNSVYKFRKIGDAITSETFHELR